MKILAACTPATGHLNPLMAMTNFLIEDGHEVVFLSGSAYRHRIEKCGARFHPLSGKADVDFADFTKAVPELVGVEPGFEWLRIVVEKGFINRIADQDRGLKEILSGFAADAILADDMFFGLLPMLLGDRADRPPVLVCGTSILHWRRHDKAPIFLGLPLASTSAQLKEYEAIAGAYDQSVDQPTLRQLNAILEELGAGRLDFPMFEATVALADTYLQLSVPGLEFPRSMPSCVKFVGRLPIIPGQAALPPWADDVDRGRRVVLVTQGTLANHDFSLLVGPTLQALAKEPDILVVATGGGRSVDAIPGPIPDNARLADYLPFEWLLPKVDVLVTNGGYGSVNQALSHGIPIVAAGLTEDKADVNARIAWSGAGIDLKTNNPTPTAIRAAVRRVLDTPDCRGHARRLASEFAGIDTRAEILRLLRRHQVVANARAA